MKYSKEIVFGAITGTLLLIVLIGIAGGWFTGIYASLAWWFLGILIISIIIFLVFRLGNLSLSQKTSDLPIQLSNEHCYKISQRLLTYGYGFTPDLSKQESRKMVYNVPMPVFVRQCIDSDSERTAWIAIRIENKFSKDSDVPDFFTVIIDPSSEEELIRELANFSGFQQYSKEVSKVVVDEFGIPVSETKVKSSDTVDNKSFSIDLEETRGNDDT